MKISKESLGRFWVSIHPQQMPSARFIASFRKRLPDQGRQALQVRLRSENRASVQQKLISQVPLMSAERSALGTGLNPG